MTTTLKKYKMKFLWFSREGDFKWKEQTFFPFLVFSKLIQKQITIKIRWHKKFMWVVCLFIYLLFLFLLVLYMFLFVCAIIILVFHMELYCSTFVFLAFKHTHTYSYLWPLLTIVVVLYVCVCAIVAWKQSGCFWCCFCNFWKNFFIQHIWCEKIYHQQQLQQR